MLTVALIGADGAGKTTIARRLEFSSSLPVKYVYMGISPISSNYALPTTRLIAAIKRALGRKPDMLGPPDPTRTRRAPKSRLKRLLSAVKSTMRVGNRVAEEWYRQLVSWYFQRRGYIVVYDRHFFCDYYAHDVANDEQGRSWLSRFHGFLLSRLYPRPELIVFLDAPPTVLLERKGEGTLELLESRRQEYLQLRDQVKHFALVDASRPLDEVTGEVAKLISHYHEDKNRSRV